MRTGMEWDEWYHELCIVVAKKSQCLSRKIGGPPRGVMTCDLRWLHDKEMRKAAGFDKYEPMETLADAKEFHAKHKKDLEGVCPRYVPEMGFKSGEGLEWCVAGHAERNALINAARFGIATKGLKIYMDCGVPCTPCLVEIINAGIEEIIVTKMTFYDQSSEYLLKQSRIPIRVYKHLCDHDTIYTTPISKETHCTVCKKRLE
jgi:dCMP deaminase